MARWRCPPSTHALRHALRAGKAGREEAGEVSVGDPGFCVPEKEDWPGQGVDTHMTQEATGRKGPVWHVVGAGVSEFKGDACVPPTTELTSVDDSGLGRRSNGQRSKQIWYMRPQPLLHRTQEYRPPASSPTSCTSRNGAPSPPPRPLTPRSCSFMCKSQSLTPRRAS